MSKRIMVVLVALGLVVAGFAAGGLAKGGAKRVASLSGENEVPEADPDGSGKGTIRLKKGDGEVCFTVKWENIGSPTKAHIHDGPAGQNGGIVVTLFDSATALPSTISEVRGCAEDVDEELIEDIKKNPEEFYVNVHNEEFPNGAIRGQLQEP
ncbi:MAG: CHRD domain-containing protein [Actinomycetota bacterium]